VMAAWLYTIVKGNERVYNDDDGRRLVADDEGSEDAVLVMGTSTVMTDKKEKVAPMTTMEGTTMMMDKVRMCIHLYACMIIILLCYQLYILSYGHVMHYDTKKALRSYSEFSML
jgi:hypothetical protein